MHGLEVIRLRPSIQHLLPSDFTAIIVLVAHCVWTDVQSQTDGLGGLLHVAATLNDVLRCNFEGSRAVFLLEAPGEVALVVVLPLEHAGDLIDKFGGLDPLARLVHRPLIRALQRRVRIVVE